MASTIILKLERDQARAVQHTFCPFLERYCESKIINAVCDDEKLIYQIIRSIFLDIYKMVCKKLLTDANKFTFNFSEAEAITLYKLLIVFPIKSDQVWHINLRQMITDSIYNQLITLSNEKESLQV
jgi:hypothetical protein